MKHVKQFSLALSLILPLALNAAAADWYVNNATGRNPNAGNAPDVPFKNIQKAIDAAAAGDTIKVAKGNYYGTMNKGNIVLNKGLTLEGGYAPDFAERDIFKHPTLLQPDNNSNGTGSDKALLYLEIKDDNSVTVLDGLFLDKGVSNNYHLKDGVVEGVEGGMLIHPPTTTKAGLRPNAKQPLIGGQVNGDIVIRNCVFANGNNFGVQFAKGKGTARVENNVFVANAMAAAEIRGAMRDPHLARLEFAHNTVLFTWSRLKDLSDMGYAVRAMTQMDYDIHDNIIGFSTFAAVDATRDDPNRELKIDNNIFLLNRQADLTLPGGGMFLRVWVDDFEDLEIASSGGNTAPEDLSILADRLNKAYATGFLNVTYKEEADYDENSPANVFRSAMGQNKQGKLTTQVSMYGNRYPLEDALKLFGAIPGTGAQLPGQ